ncbi:MAG: hypothetical protein KVP17_003889 [Porospora cf. gigantea B]|uniref:uncharacterized protein n=1 Tax=Porospora cf. gigantea B TaxID=2853592 RepID=UPI003571D33E|nr:MAG: hypothetical protein KVP17_003889 [Porospora cf. gigantea B]
MQMAHNQHNLDDIDTESLHIHVLEDNFILLESVADVKFINLQHIEIVFMFDGAAVASLLKAIQAFNFTCHFSAMTSDPDREIGVDTGSLDAFDIPYHGQMGSGDIRLQPEGVTITGPLDRFAVVNQSFIELDSLLSFSRTSSQCNMVFRGQYPVVLDLETNERCRPFMHNLREYFIYEPLRFAKPEPPLPAVALRSRGLEMAQHQRQYVNQSSPLAKSEDFTIQIRFGDEESALGDWIPGLTGLKDGQLYLSPPEGEISTETTELQLHTLEPRCVHWDPVRECYSLRDLIAVNKVSSDTVEK